MEIPAFKRSNSAENRKADWGNLPDNVIEKIAGHVVAKNGCFLKSRYGLSINHQWRWIALRSAKTRTHLQVGPSSKMTTPAGNPSFSVMYRELEINDLSNLKHLEMKNISSTVSVKAIWRRLQNLNFTLKSLKIKEDYPKDLFIY